MTKTIFFQTLTNQSELTKNLGKPFSPTDSPFSPLLIVPLTSPAGFGTGIGQT